FALLNLAITAFELGDYSEMRAMAKAAEAMATQLNSRFPLGMAMTLEAVAAAYMGDLGAVRDRLADALALAHTLNHKYMQSQVLLYQVDVLLQLGRLDEARAQGRTLQTLLMETGDREPESRVNVLMAEVVGRLGDLEAAGTYAKRALEAATAAHARGIRVRAEAVTAWIALRSGDHAEARRVAEEALRTAKQIGSQYQMARLYGLLGEALLVGGQPNAAHCFEMASAIAGSIGATTLRAKALFGLAAAEPHDSRSIARVGEAQTALRRVVASLDDESRAAFLSIKERQLVLAGDHAAFGLPAPTLPAAED
ncbi:MAG: tetratricopeptide repeat protein, partial [Candidatus Sericytochromatia bacterium]